MNLLSYRNVGASTKLMRGLLCAIVAIGSLVTPATPLLAASTITYRQGNGATPQTPQTTVNVTFTSAQLAGDLNVVVVGWTDTTATVASVVDVSNNAYTLAVGPTLNVGYATQSIYYAKNIAAATAGTNRVTVTFTAAAAFPDIRILEYTGADLVNPVDVTAAASGTGTSTSSGAVTTTNATDLIFGANTVQQVTTGPGASFTKRLLSAPNGDISEDRMVAAVGSYSAVAPQAPSGRWIMQLVAFRTPSADSQPPTAPTSLTATVTGNQVGLNWTAATDNIGVTSYRIERCQGVSCATFAQIGTSGATMYTDAALAPGSFSYRVRATDAAGNLSPYSNVASGVVPDTQAPTAPASLTATISGSQISLSWTASTDNVGVTGYQVERCQGIGCSTFALIMAPTATAYTDAGLSIGSYSYRVRATDTASNVSPYSNTATGAITDTQAPTAPTTLVAMVNGTEIDLSWTASTDNVGVSGYRVERCQGAACSNFLQVATTTATTYSDLSLAIGTYTYRVRAVDAAANTSAYSNSASGSIPDTQAPTAPSTLTATPSGSQVNLSWTAATDNVGVTGYQVERCQGAGCSTFAQIGTATLTTYSDSGLSMGSYSYRVRATDAGSNLSPYSPTATGVIADTQAPTAPTNLIATVSGAQISLSWTASTDNLGVTGYQVERCQGAGCASFAAIGSPTVATAYSDASLAPGAYSYRVKASDAAGNISPASNVAGGSIADTQPPTAPANLTASANGTRINLAWTASTDDVGVAGYQVERCQGPGCNSFARVATPVGTAYSDLNLAVDAFSYRVRATDTATNLSAYSTVASATTSSAGGGLAAAYAFSEGLGGTTADASGNSITGTLQGPAWTTSGKYGNALAFNGTTFVDLGAPAALGSSGSMTWEAWVFPTGVPGDDGQIMARSNGATGWQFKSTPDTGRRTFAVGVSGATNSLTQRYGATAISLNTWYHVAAVYNSQAQTLDLYVNGVLDNGTLRGTVPASQVVPAGVNGNIGRRTGGFNFIGTLDELRVYGRALTPTEIQADMTTPVGTAADTQPPTAPSNLVATPASGSMMSLSWTGSTDNIGVSTYLLERCAGVGCTDFLQIAAPRGTTFSDSGLTPSTTYSYRVRAGDAANNLSPYSSVASGATQPPQPPTAPGNLTASPISVSQIYLTWSSSSADLGISDYFVERCQGAGCTAFAQIAQIPQVGKTSTIYTDTGLPSNTTFTYRVRAMDNGSNVGPYSSVASTTTLIPTLPTAPTNLAATAVSGTQINLSWTASTSGNGIANYNVQRCQNAGCTTFAQIATPVGTTYNDAGLTTGTTYSYQVQAVDTVGGVGPVSNVASATAISGLTAAYGFNEGAGSIAVDASQSGINGTIQGATWTTAGKYGNALSFDGVGFVDLGSPVALGNTGSMTVEGWVFATATPVDDGQIIARSNDAAGWQLKTTPDSGPRTFGISITGTPNVFIERFSQTTVALNTWYHVAGVYNASAQTLDIYVNGVLDNGSLRGAVPSSQVLPAGVNATIGERNGGFNFLGTLDEIRLYSRALSAAEVQTDMTTPLPRSVALVNPSSLDFGNVAVNTASAPQAVTLTNTGDAPLTVTGVTINGTGAGSYSETNTCGTSLAPGANCTINVTLTPVAAGTLAATLVILDNASNTHDVALTGVGVGGAFTVTPHTATLTPIGTQQFTTTSSVTWSVDGISGGSASVGTISATGLYTPPTSAGIHTVTATNTNTAQTVTSTVYVTTYAGTFTRNVDQLRLGLNSNETVLTAANVNQTRFGKLTNYGLDGLPDASPLYAANVNVPGTGPRNIVYVATEHDSVYAFDADGGQAAPLWIKSFINPANGVTSVPSSDTGECCDITPEIGITGTPVIDPATNTLYVVAKTREQSGSLVNYFHRLHAMDLGTGAEKFGGPVVIQASVPGSGSGAVGGQVPFLSLHENQRPALLLSNGVVYIAFAGHGDNTPYHGWVLGYNASTLQQVLVFCTSPNDPGSRQRLGGTGSGIWQSGDGLATDSAGNIYLVTGNGLFDANSGGSDYGDTLMKINPLGTVLDYFTPHDQATMNFEDFDFGSGGVLVLPDQAGPNPHLAIVAGKTGTIYVVNRDNFGHYNPSNDNQIVQTLVNIFPHGEWWQGNFRAPVFWNGHLYFSSQGDFIKSFAMTNGLLTTTATSQSSFVANYPGAMLGLSANGNTNGILWAVQRVDINPNGSGGPRGPGVLHAFDANNLGTELYNSTQAGTRDQLDIVPKFTAPLVANGKVFVASQTQLTIYGLLP